MTPHKLIHFSDALLHSNKVNKKLILNIDISIKRPDGSLYCDNKKNHDVKKPRLSGV